MIPARRGLSSCCTEEPETKTMFSPLSANSTLAPPRCPSVPRGQTIWPDPDPSFLLDDSNGATMAAACLLLFPRFFSGCILLRPLLPLRPRRPKPRGGKRVCIGGPEYNRQAPLKHAEVTASSIRPCWHGHGLAGLPCRSCHPCRGVSRRAPRDQGRRRPRICSKRPLRSAFSRACPGSPARFLRSRGSRR